MWPSSPAGASVSAKSMMSATDLPSAMRTRMKFSMICRARPGSLGMALEKSLPYIVS
ncbi:MAG: hypothetical protein QM765_14650 [Myxococcales bacterium]